MGLSYYEMEQYENSLAHLKAARIIYIEVKGEDSEDVKDITDLIEVLLMK